MANTAADIDSYLRSWLGAWPPASGGLEVVGHRPRARPAWDGELHPVIGVIGPDGGVLSVAPDAVDAVREFATRPQDTQSRQWRRDLGEAMGIRGRNIIYDVFRWLERVPDPARFPDVGEWVPADGPETPAWLQPFHAHEALVARDEQGRVLGAAGVKIQTDNGAELAVNIVPPARGRGIGTRLVSQTCRRLTDEGRLPVLSHEKGNIGSARMADAAGFSDAGWGIVQAVPREAAPNYVAHRLRRQLTTRRLVLRRGSSARSR